MPSTRDVFHGRDATLRPPAVELSSAAALAVTATGLAAVLAVIVQAFDLGAATLVAALGAYALLAAAVAVLFGRARGEREFGLANTVTLVRGAFNCLLLGLLSEPGRLAGAWGEAAGWLFVAVALLSLALDGVDGWAARRWRLASPFGARFDVEVDALLASVLALAGVVLGKVGVWVLVLPALYYLFVAARRLRPWLAAPVPPSLARKTVFVVQAVSLVLIVAPPVPSALAELIAAAALAVVLASFARDLRWLHRNRPPATGVGRARA